MYKKLLLAVPFYFHKLALRFELMFARDELSRLDVEERHILRWMRSLDVREDDLSWHIESFSVKARIQKRNQRAFLEAVRDYSEDITSFLRHIGNTYEHTDRCPEHGPCRSVAQPEGFMVASCNQCDFEGKWLLY